MSTLHHALQRWEDLLVGKIASRAEEDQRVRLKTSHEYLLLIQEQSHVLQKHPGMRNSKRNCRLSGCSYNCSILGLDDISVTFALPHFGYFQISLVREQFSLQS